MSKALSTGVSVARTLGYAATEEANLYTAGPMFVRDLVELNPHSYGQLFATVFRTEEINTATLLDYAARSDWASILASRQISTSSRGIASDIAARYSGYYEVPIYHAEDGCTAHVRFMAAKASSWSASNFCPQLPMLSALDAQQLTGLTQKPVLVTFEHTDTGWGMMWLVGAVAVQPYNGEVYIVTKRDGTVVDPLKAEIPLEIQEDYALGRYGLVPDYRFILPIQLRPLSLYQATE